MRNHTLHGSILIGRIDVKDPVPVPKQLIHRRFQQAGRESLPSLRRVRPYRAQHNSGELNVIMPTMGQNDITLAYDTARIEKACVTPARGHQLQQVYCRALGARTFQQRRGKTEAVLDAAAKSEPTAGRKVNVKWFAAFLTIYQLM